MTMNSAHQRQHFCQKISFKAVNFNAFMEQQTDTQFAGKVHSLNPWPINVVYKVTVPKSVTLSFKDFYFGIVFT
jgi:hypothetical protein